MSINSSNSNLNITPLQNKDIPFRLLRYFTLISLISMSLTSIGLWYRFEKVFTDNLIVMEEHNNIALALMLSQSIWPDYQVFLSSASGLTAAKLKKHPVIKRLDKNLADITSGTGVIKIKMKKFQELIRDVERRKPLLREELAKRKGHSLSFLSRK